MSSRQLLAVATALADANEAALQWARTGAPVAKQTAAAVKGLLTALAAIGAISRRPGGVRRGPKIRFDQDWASAQLLDLVIRHPDGMPQSQSVLVDHLHLAFATKGNAIPSRTWLRNVVRDFCSRANAHERATREKFRNSPELVSLFQSENEYVVFTRIRDRFAEKWWREKPLQKRFSSASEYVAAMLQSDRKNSAVEALKILNNSDTPDW